MTYGEQFSEAVAEYLTANGLSSLGKINRKILGELADRFNEKWQAAQKAKKTPKKRTKDPNHPKYQIPPSLEMVRARIAEMGYTFHAEKFMAHYDSNGWKVGRNVMIDWQAACVTFQGDTPRRSASPSAAAKPSKKAMPEPTGWRAIALQTEGLEWAGNGPTWDSLLEFYQQRLANLCRNRDAAERQQEITDRIAP